MFSCLDGHELCARALIEAGASVGAQNHDGMTSLITACENGHLSCAELLIKAHADVNKTQDNNGFSALMFACQNNHEHCARALIEAGARKDAKSNEGSTALSLARGHAAVCELLEG